MTPQVVKTNAEVMLTERNGSEILGFKDTLMRWAKQHLTIGSVIINSYNVLLSTMLLLTTPVCV